MRLKPKDNKTLIEAAMGLQTLDLLIENIKLVNLFTGEIYPASVGIYDGFIASIMADPDGLQLEQEYTAKAVKTINGVGRYLIPGFIDAHIHIESTMMTPTHFTEAVVPWGTTTVVTDPHEIANVFGVKGVRYMHQDGDTLPMRQLILVPSCVPAVPGKENAGAAFGAEEVEELLKLERVCGLGEVMDFPGVINNDPRMVEILATALSRDLFIQGHAPGMFGRALSAYLCGGPISDHESRSGQEARDKIRAGMYVDARQSSISENVKDIFEAVKDFEYHDFLTFCTDDREPGDILATGHMNDVVKTAISAGMAPVKAIRSATLHTAREMGYTNLGAVAPGYAADLLLVSSLEDPAPEIVIFNGAVVAENRHLLAQLPESVCPIELKSSVKIPQLKLQDLEIKAPRPGDTILVNVLVYEGKSFSLSKWNIENLPVRNGLISIDHDPELSFALVQNRYGKTDRCLAVVRNFGLYRGAVGSTVSHDCHNLTVVFDTPENALAVIKGLEKTGGGIASAERGIIQEILPLPVGGLISELKCAPLAEQCEKMKTALQKQGLTEISNPLLRIVTLALPVIPEAKLSDMGLIEVLTQEFVPLFPEAS